MPSSSGARTLHSTPTRCGPGVAPRWPTTSARARSPRKGRNKISWEAIAKNIRAHARYRAGVEHSIDAALGMIGHHQSAERQTSVSESAFGVIPDFYILIIVFQVRGVAICPEVAPLANDGATQKSIVRFIAVPKKDGGTHFSPHFTKWSDGYIAPHFAAHVHH